MTSVLGKRTASPSDSDDSEQNGTKKSKVADASSSASANGDNKVVKITLEFFKNDAYSTEDKVNDKRVRWLKNAAKTSSKTAESGPVVYWINRAGRVQDNWALLFAQQTALQRKVPLAVIFNVVPNYLGAGWRQYDFMLKGLQEVEKDCRSLNIAFFMLAGNPIESVPGFMARCKSSLLVTDMSPLRIGRMWREGICAKLPADASFAEVDGHNIVPVWIASEKQEYSAATFRRRISKHYDEFLTEFPSVLKHTPSFPHECIPVTSGSHDSSSSSSASSSSSSSDSSSYVIYGGDKPVDWAKLESTIQCDRSILPVRHILPGSRAGLANLYSFLNFRIKKYHDLRNKPEHDQLSNMSPYFHFGHVAPQRAVLAALKYSKSHKESVDGFFEECVVRRELADNFCFYNPKYDSFEGFPNWAQQTLKDHEKDKRPYTYSDKQLEQGKTHDDLWNTAQLEMVHCGKMHGYVRMYWAKKILEWSPTPAKAYETAVYLNDKYELDGRDPNGFVGCAWAIGGVHDQGWAERAVFGKVRCMTYDSTRKKFDLQGYIRRVQQLILKASK